MNVKVMSITELGGSERMSIECRKTKTKEITTANQTEGIHPREPMRTQSLKKKLTTKLPKARQVVI